MILPQNSQKAITQAALPIAATLADRPARAPDLAAENQVLHTLARQPIDDPQSTLKTLVRIAKDLSGADSVAIGLFETLPDNTKVFRWVAIAGELASLEQTIAPSNLSPGDTAIHCGQPQLYAHPELYFTYLHHPQFPIVEGMLFPLCANDRPLGTLWLLSHNQQRLLDREDERLMTSLVGFAATALQNIHLGQIASEALQREQAARLETAATRQALAESAQSAVQILESITDAVICLDREWRITYVNQEVTKINNRPPEEIIGKTHWEIWPWSVGTIVEQTYRQVVADRVAAHFEVFYESLKMWFEIHAYPTIAGLSIYFRDITDHKQAELVLIEQKRLLELTASGQPLEECLSALCAAMSKLNADIRACILLTDARRQTFPRSIAPDLLPSFGQGLKDAPINDLAIGTCGEAVYSNRPVTCADIARDDRWSQEWRDLCVAHGVLACHSAPIPGADSLPLGSLMLCFGEARMPTDWEYRLADFGTHIASIAINRDRSILALRESEAKYRTLTELSTHHVWMLDATGELIFLNQSFLDYFGKSLDQLKRENWAENVHHPDDRDRVVQEIDRAMAAGIKIRSEHRLRRHDDQFRWFLNEATPLRDRNGEITHWLGASVDIDDSKQAADALHQSEEQSRNILESITDAFLALDRDWRFTYVNRQAERLLDRAPGDLLGKSLWEVYPGIVGSEFERAYRQAASERLASSVISFYPDHDRWYEVHVYPATDGITIYFRNVTDRKRIEAEREQLLQREQVARETAENANRIKDEFLAVLSHELRSPLSPILGWSSLLQTGKLDASKTTRALATIERNAKLQAELIEDLLDVSRILQGKLSLNVSPVNLASTIQAAIETVRLAAEAKSIQVEVDIDPNASYVSGDATRLQQVVWNLLSNAVKFTPNGGRVQIRLTQADDRAAIAIRDNGQGIAREFLPYVFDYFRQADSASTRKFGGLGLGLAIVRHLVELHGGTVASDSPGEGLGATFTVKLPLMPIAGAKDRAEQFTPSSPNLQGVQVLVVDDDTDTRELVVFLLEEAGAIVTSASSASEAFAALSQFQPDILLCDIGMPEMNGYTLIRQMRGLPPQQGGQIPAIALTAYAGDFDRKQALAAGFQHHLAKPIEPNELVHAIVTLLEQLPRRSSY
ncbi:MAG: PAS domain-containing protein [Microcoleus sp. CSU_2_2]|nr:PAS domain-containing protein [Microcoleus sp. SU_5_3]NJS09052.1 PAS domain-containing protein [Microcoleus sp. CSU_2_2]